MADKNTTRSKLTLKLPTASGANTLTLKGGQNKKINNTSVEVTIKGRKKDTNSNKNHESDLNKSEFEARMKAIASTNTSKKEVADHDIISKLSKETVTEEIKEIEKVEEVIEVKEIEEKLAPIEIKEEIKEETKEEIKEEAQEEVKEIIIETPKEVVAEKVVEEAVITPKDPIKINPNYSLDAFDVRNKIKQSIQITNREKEEREKVLEERRKLEKEKLAKEAAAKEAAKMKKSPSSPKTNYKATEEKSFNKNDKTAGKPAFKTQRRSKKLSYIIDGSDYENKNRRKKRKDKQFVSEEVKDYKKISHEVALPDLIVISDLASRMSEKTGDVVKKLFSMGVVVTSNQAIDADTAEIIIAEFGHTAKRVSHSDVENILEDSSVDNLKLLPRAPVVTIMGHVDHGKTSLLDALRRTDIVSGEHGGITQHIGASRIKTKSGENITFLDTPGHEAFTEMRSRGANVTDIVILVVAADDGVKAQTIEAISHAKAADVPIIVAVNKIDKPGSDPERVKNELLSHDIISEDMGGDVMFVPVSAKSGTNLDKLEEAVLLQAEILDLKSPYEGKASGVVLESRVDLGKGAVSTLLVQKGSLDISDLIVVGTSYGKIRKMSDDNGKNIKVATPSFPVEVLGLDVAPKAGDIFVEVDEERQAREIISYRARKEKEEKALRTSASSIAEIFKQSGEGKMKYLNIVIKGDVHGSVEAINGSVIKLNDEEVAVKVVHMATGAISESDVNLAAVSDALIVGFNVRANPAAKELARTKNTNIRYYSIIYNLIDDLKLLLSGMLSPTQNEEYLGKVDIRQIFKISNTGKVAGSFVTDGVIKRNAQARLLRDDVVIHDGILKTLKRFKEDVKEVKNGFECGIAFENFEDIKEGDTVECYEITQKKRTFGE